MTEGRAQAREGQLAALLLEVAEELDYAAEYAGLYFRNKYGWDDLIAKAKAAAMTAPARNDR